MKLADFDILIACEFSGTIRDMFIRRGYRAISCDLRPSAIPGPHIQGDVIPVLHAKRWKLVIAHPPCTYLCNSGVRHLYKDGKKVNGRDMDRWTRMELAVDFFLECFNANSDHTAVENPIMHGYAKALGPGHQDCLVQPWMFGEPYSKATCWWLQNLEPLVPKYPTLADFFNRTRYDAVLGEIHNMPPSPDRGIMRSIIYPGIARAVVDQWGKWV